MDSFFIFRRFAASVMLGLACSAMAQTATVPDPAPADAPGVPYLWRLEFSPHTTHFSYNEDHRPVHLVGLERESSVDNHFYGLALFTNSFGQNSGYAYWGKSYYNVFDSLPRVYLKWSAGVLYGYMPPYNHKVPLNYRGFSPAIVPAAGWRFGSGWNAQIDLLGTAGLTYSLVKEF